MTENTSESFANLLTRDGHLSELTMDRYLYETLEPNIKQAIEAHLESCEYCRNRLAEIQAMDANISISPPVATAEKAENNVVSLNAARTNKPRSWAGLACALAAAAALVIVMRPGAEQETISGNEAPDAGYRLKGAKFELNVVLNDGKGGQHLDDGDVVHSGDTIGFSVQIQDNGYLLIQGLDESGKIYNCYPANGTEAVAYKGTDRETTLNEYIEFDDVLGKERITGIWCPRHFTGQDVEKVIRGTGKALPTSCQSQTITLTKKTRGVR